MSRNTIKSRKNIKRKAYRHHFTAAKNNIDWTNIFNSMVYICLILFISFEITSTTNITLTILRAFFNGLSYVFVKTYDLTIYPIYSLFSYIATTSVNLLISSVKFGIDNLNYFTSEIIKIDEIDKNHKPFMIFLFWLAICMTLFSLVQYTKWIYRASQQTINNYRLRINRLSGVHKYNIKCPLCNCSNNFNDVFKIYGINEHCKVCLDNHVNILLPKCKHAILCEECLETMSDA